MLSESGLSVGLWIASIAILSVFIDAVWRWAETALPPASVVDKKVIEKGAWRSID